VRLADGQLRREEVRLLGAPPLHGLLAPPLRVPF